MIQQTIVIIVLAAIAYQFRTDVAQARQPSGFEVRRAKLGSILKHSDDLRICEQISNFISPKYEGLRARVRS